MNARVAVILVNWNSYAVTSGCIDSLYAMHYHDFTIVVVDNASADGSGILLKEKYPQIELIQSGSNLGFTGNNLGLDYAVSHGYEYVLLLNNDTIVTPGFIETLLLPMDTEPDIGAIQPLIYFEHDRSLVWNGGSFFRTWIGMPYTRNYNQRLKQENNVRKNVDWITGCAFLVRTDLIRETGPLAPNLFMYYEDVDLSFRIAKKGYKLVYEPASVIYHIAGASSRSEQKKAEGPMDPAVHYYNTRNRIWLLKKNTKPIFYLSTAAFSFFYLLGIMGYFLVRLRFTKLQSVLRGIRDGLSGNIQYADPYR